jgi:hypothetical protein
MQRIVNMKLRSANRQSPGVNMPDQQPPQSRSIEELIADSERLQESARQIADRMSKVFRYFRERTGEIQNELPRRDSGRVQA